MIRRKWIIVAAAALLASASIPASLHLGRQDQTRQMLASLSSYGFTSPQIGTVSYQNDSAVFTDITLDSDKFSTIRAIQAKTGLIDMLLKKSPRSLIIDDIRLTGAMTEETGLTVTGWKKQPLPFPAWDEIVLTGGQIDLDTGAGALRFQAKGQGTKQKDGSLKVQSLVWGVQNQIRIDAGVTGVLYPGGEWTYDIELKDASVNLDKIKASRMSGWITVEKDAVPVTSLSGQIDAGQMNMGDLSFSDFNVAFEGPLEANSLVAKARVYGFQNMLATLDVKYNAAEPQIKAAIETASLDDLVSFLQKMRTSETHAGSLTSLLLTQGNLDRLRKEVSELKYDMLELQIYGPLYDLAGKVIVKTFTNGTEQRHIISLDPGNG